MLGWARGPVGGFSHKHKGGAREPLPWTPHPEKDHQELPALHSFLELPTQGECIIIPRRQIAQQCILLLYPLQALQSLKQQGKVAGGIQEHLRLTVDQTHLSSLIVNSSHLAHPRHPGKTLLFNPCSFTSDLLLQQHGCESVSCLGASGELCVVPSLWETWNGAPGLVAGCGWEPQVGCSGTLRSIGAPRVLTWACLGLRVPFWQHTSSPSEQCRASALQVSFPAFPKAFNLVPGANHMCTWAHIKSAARTLLQTLGVAG